MKLSISNIAWSEEYDQEMYDYLLKSNFEGLEIAPTRLIKEEPYSKIELIKEISKNLNENYQLEICSMQSIWYGKNEKMFSTLQEYETLLDYTKKTIDFASAIDCKNLVFGCPKNRVINDIKIDYPKAISFFREIGEYAKKSNVVFAIEANPTIYNTNFINTTQEAIDIVKDINCDGVKINLDLGTMIQNKESIEILKNNISLINHVHISEPNLDYIESRDLHKELIKLLKENDYQGYISIEMKNQNDIEMVKKVIDYVSNIIREV